MHKTIVYGIIVHYELNMMTSNLCILKYHPSPKYVTHMCTRVCTQMRLYGGDMWTKLGHKNVIFCLAQAVYTFAGRTSYGITSTLQTSTKSLRHRSSIASP